MLRPALPTLLLAALLLAGCTAEPPGDETPEETTDPYEEGLSANVTAVDGDDGNASNETRHPARKA